jgi:hypothetical protein
MFGLRHVVVDHDCQRLDEIRVAHRETAMRG